MFTLPSRGARTKDQQMLLALIALALLAHAHELNEASACLGGGGMNNLVKNDSVSKYPIESDLQGEFAPTRSFTMTQTIDLR